MIMPGVVWLAGRAIGFLVFVLVARARDRSVMQALTSRDGKFFLRIAQNGYPAVPAGVSSEHADHLAFFAGYPLLTRWAGQLLGIEVRSAAFLVTGLAGVAMAFGLVELARAAGRSRRVGLLWVGLVGASPLSVVFLMSYSEALFCAFAIWAMVAVLHRHWPLAALLAVAAGWTRPTGAAVVAVVVIAALLAGWRAGGRQRALCWISATVAPLGLIGYLGFVAARTHALTGWFQIQTLGWHTRFDGGAGTWAFLRGQLASQSMEPDGNRDGSRGAGSAGADLGGRPDPATVAAAALLTDSGSNGATQRWRHELQDQDAAPGTAAVAADSHRAQPNQDLHTGSGPRAGHHGHRLVRCLLPADLPYAI